MKSWFQSPQTTIGAVIALAGVGMIVIGKSEAGMSLIGVAATWIGITAKDSTHDSTKQ